MKESGEQDASERAYAEHAQASELPALDFVTFILSMSQAALHHLGDAPDPVSGAHEQDLALARQTIDLLGMLQEKTRGNLAGDEERALSQELYELRLRFVEVAKGAKGAKGNQ